QSRSASSGQKIAWSAARNSLYTQRRRVCWTSRAGLCLHHDTLLAVRNGPTPAHIFRGTRTHGSLVLHRGPCVGEGYLSNRAPVEESVNSGLGHHGFLKCIV